jgi:hypothetical protein
VVAHKPQEAAVPKMPEKVEDFTAPWETASGETEIDKARLKKYLFNLLHDKEKLQESVAAVTKERDDLKTAADAKSREGESEVDKLKRELEEARKSQGKAPEGEDLEVTKLRIALRKGLSESEVKRLIGANEKELEADADELLKSFGREGKGQQDGDDSDAGNPGRRAPRGRHNPGDPDPGAGMEVDVAKALDQIPRVR